MFGCCSLEVVGSLILNWTITSKFVFSAVSGCVVDGDFEVAKRMTGVERAIIDGLLGDGHGKVRGK